MSLPDSMSGPVTQGRASDELAFFMSLGSIGHLLVDPNSTLGLRMEGAAGRERGKSRDENPYSTPRYKGCLAEGHWWEGWDACDKHLARGEQS
jgi:hypothetical protein